MLAKILALSIFIIMFALIISEKFERHFITLGCGLATIVLVFGVSMRSMSAFLETLNVRNIFTVGFWYETASSSESSSGINWATILFLAGMMIMVEGMALAGFFRWLCMTIAKAVHYKVIPIFLTFMVMSFVLAMFIDSITVILFLAAVTVELAQLLKFNPIPMILSEIFCANLGGSATMCGDPPNIIIGTSLGYTFTDFVTNTGLMAILSLVVVVVFFYFCYRKQLSHPAEHADELAAKLSPKSAITNKRAFIISCIIFVCAISMLITHAKTGLTVAFIGVFIALVTLLTAGKSIGTILKRVDYKTLLFFIGLFVVVGGLEQTGILELIAMFIGKISGGNMYLMIAIIIWISAIASAFVDNIPFAATMIPVIKTLSATTGADLSVLAWTLAIGTDIGGSATPIGASANVVGTSIAAREGHPISWKKYCMASVPATIIVILISMVCIYLRYL
ncbi:MAG: anion permease [Lachnospiraceae bacterium]|nr:anion permease [Lachnospiraceae bacterium]